ncbi:hypothetical protein HZA45_01605 [Candidatus Peregrinibacteria bacterium]|nr:hypothetical protein [Candidatus Peregrinibacteria bacterium]
MSDPHLSEGTILHPDLDDSEATKLAEVAVLIVRRKQPDLPADKHRAAARSLYVQLLAGVASLANTAASL